MATPPKPPVKRKQECKVEPYNCSECGSKACICSDHINGNIHWAAHCMDCDNTIGERGFYDPCASSKREAIERWNNLNRRLNREDFDILINLIKENLTAIKEGKPLFKNDNPINRQFVIDGMTRLSERTYETFNNMLENSPILFKMYTRDIREWKAKTSKDS